MSADVKVSTGSPETRSPVIYIHLIGFLFLAAGLATNPLKITRAFFSDEAVYYTMAYSFAYDGDMEFQHADLERTYKEFSAGPSGIILKLDERDNTIVFGKAYLYSLAAAPFVSAFKTNGFFILAALLLWLNLLCGYRFCASFMEARSAILFSVFYFLANATLVYLFWMTPEYFNMSLIGYAFFFFMAGERLKSNFPLFRLPFNYILSALFFALASFSKPTNALLLCPLGIWLFYRRQVRIALLALGVYIFATMALFGANVYFTGDWNYQGGKRTVFYDHYPYERPGASPFAPFNRKIKIQAMVRPPFYAKAFEYNWLYFFFGRFSGLAIYFFPMFFGIAFFWFAKKNSLSTAAYIAGWLGILTYMVGIPWNYFGGSGTIGNRYLINAFPVFLYVLQEQPSKRWFAFGFLCSLLFSAGLLYTPVLSSFDNAFHQKRSPFTALPVEKTLLSDLPINTNLLARRVAFEEPATYFLYFLDDNTYYRETLDHKIGFWVKGGREAQLILRAFQPLTKVRAMVKSLSIPNEVTLTINSETRKINMKEPAFYEGEIPLSGAFPYDRDGTGATYLYHVRIRSSSGAIQADAAGLERYLGAFVRFELPAAHGVELPEEESEE